MKLTKTYCNTSGKNCQKLYCRVKPISRYDSHYNAGGFLVKAVRKLMVRINDIISMWIINSYLIFVLLIAYLFWNSTMFNKGIILLAPQAIARWKLQSTFEHQRYRRLSNIETRSGEFGDSAVIRFHSYLLSWTDSWMSVWSRLG